MNRRDVIGLGGTLGLSAFMPAFAKDRAPIVSRIGLLDGRVVISVTISEKGPFLFLIDTGGVTSLIDSQLARELQLQAVGVSRARGVGGEISLTTYTARNVVFGDGARQSVVSFSSMDGGFGPLVRGSLAAGILTAVDSELDFEAREWRLYPNGQSERLGFAKVGGSIRGESGADRSSASPRLYGELQLNGRKLDCLLDTGSPGTISVSYDVAQRLGLWDDTRPFAPQETRGIAGRGGLGRIVRADSAVFAGERFDKPLVLLRSPGDGALRHDGIVGLAMLEGFNLSTEVRTRSLWFQRHRVAQPLPERYSLSGLWMESKGREVRVVAVGAGSPAAIAGVQVGDHILTGDLRSAIALVAGSPGKKVRLPVLRDGRLKAHDFILTPFL